MKGGNFRFRQSLTIIAIEEHAGSGEAERHSHPYAYGAPFEDKGEEITHRDAYHHVCDEGIEHHALDLFHSSQRIGKDYLHSVAKLIEEEARQEG